MGTGKTFCQHLWFVVSLPFSLLEMTVWWSWVSVCLVIKQLSCVVFAPPKYPIYDPNLSENSSSVFLFCLLAKFWITKSHKLCSYVELLSLLPLTSHPLDFSSAVCVHFKWKVFWHFECHKETINTTMPFQTIRNTFKILFYFPPLLFSSLPPPLTMTLIELAPSMNRRIRRLLQWSDSSIGVRTSGVPCTRPVSQLFPFGHLLEWGSILWRSQFLWIQDQNKTTDETWKWV